MIERRLASLRAAPSAMADDVPRVWVEPSSGRRVVRLSEQPGSRSLYFHQKAFTVAGDKMLLATPDGLSTVDLRSERVEPLARGAAGHVVVGPRSRQAFYVRNGAIHAAHVDTGETWTVATLPRGWLASPDPGDEAMLSVNADETLLVGVLVAGRRSLIPGRHRWPPNRGRSLAALARLRRPSALYTVAPATGELRIVHTRDAWLNHVQCSPTDPTLVLFCHEGPWHEVERLWTVRTDGSDPRPLHARTMPMEIAGHEFFSPDGAIVWYDLQTPRGKEFWLAGVVLATGEKLRYPLARDAWSVHYNASPDGARFAGDGAGPRSVAAPGHGSWISLLERHDRTLSVERLVDLRGHDYRLEPNVRFTPDGSRIVFRSNLHGPTHVYAVDVAGGRDGG